MDLLTASARSATAFQLLPPRTAANRHEIASGWRSALGFG